MSTNKEDVKNALEEKLESAEFPVSSILELSSELPNGPATKFVTEDTTITAMELASYRDELDFPYDSADELVNHAMKIIEDDDYFDEDIGSDSTEK